MPCTSIYIVFIERWCAKLYKDYDYAGLVTHAHKGADNLEILNEAVSSVKVREGCIFTGYEDQAQKGDSILITDDTPSLKDNDHTFPPPNDKLFDDIISSYTCTCFDGKYIVLKGYD